MPRLREPPTTAKKEEPFDSTVLEAKKPEKEEPAEPVIAAPEEPVDEVVIEEPKKEAKEAAEHDDAAQALKRQIEALRRNEEIIKNEREDALRAYKEQADAILKSQRRELEAQEIAIENTRKAARAAADKALLDYKNALDSGDNAAAADAMDRLTDAKSEIRAFERDSEELKLRRKELKKARKQFEEGGAAQSQQQQPPQLHPNAVKWRNAHPEYFQDDIKYLEMSVAYKKALKEGYTELSDEHVKRINEMLGLDDEGGGQQERKPHIPVSAPVSRDIPSGDTGRRQSGRITLNRDQLEAAKMAGVTPQEYARQLMKLNEMKANGEYGERR